MKFHINIPHITDFYLTISRSDPYASPRQTIVNEVNVNRHSLDEERLTQSYDRINMWIGNCDQKASFLLAIIGVLMTVAFTSDEVKSIKALLIMPFKQYWLHNQGSFDCYRFLVALFLVICITCLLVSVIYLLFSLKSRTDYSRFKQDGMEEQSMLFYGHIAGKTYRNFAESEFHLLNDLRSQVYTNACICADKFRYYRCGLNCFLISLPFAIITFLLMLFL